MAESGRSVSRRSSNGSKTVVIELRTNQQDGDQSADQHDGTNSFSSTDTDDNDIADDADIESSSCSITTDKLDRGQQGKDHVNERPHLGLLNDPERVTGTYRNYEGQPFSDSLALWITLHFINFCRFELNPCPCSLCFVLSVIADGNIRIHREFITQHRYATSSDAALLLRARMLTLHVLHQNQLFSFLIRKILFNCACLLVTDCTTGCNAVLYESGGDPRR